MGKKGVVDSRIALQEAESFSGAVFSGNSANC